MKVRVVFNFKAATGFGAIVDGSVTGTSVDHVTRDLIRQGLIPVRVWPERVQASFAARSAMIFKHGFGRLRAIFLDSQVPFER